MQLVCKTCGKYRIECATDVRRKRAVSLKWLNRTPSRYLGVAESIFSEVTLECTKRALLLSYTRLRLWRGGERGSGRVKGKRKRSKEKEREGIGIREGKREPTLKINTVTTPFVFVRREIFSKWNIKSILQQTLWVCFFVAFPIVGQLTAVNIWAA